MARLARPRGGDRTRILVPALVHRGHPVYESHEIPRYAAEHAG